LNIYDKDYSISEDETTDDSFGGSRPSARLQMRGRFIELKIAQPRDTAQSVRKSRPLHPTYNYYQQPQYHQPYFNLYNDYSSDDGTYDDRDKFSATLSQHEHHHRHNHQTMYQHHHHHGYNTVVPPMTPGGPQQYNHQTPMKTPATPAQTVLDIAHHMLFYAQLLATPSMASSIPQDELHYYHDQILKSDEYVHGDDVDSTTAEYVAPFQQLPRPCTPSLSVPDVIVSPSKRTKEVFTIGGGTFYPDVPEPISPAKVSTTMLSTK
jgi:hypothetical protein